MEPRWQIRKVVEIDGAFHVDRNNRAAGGIWGSFFALVLWIASNVLLLQDLFAYVDDTFSYDEIENKMYYAPYHHSFPTKQTRFLLLLDKLGIPHDKPKQVYGLTLLIIGLVVDPNEMSITMPSDCRTDLILAIRKFASPRCGWKLREFQQIGGWINWALNAYPLLRPGLSALYEKMAGKSHANERIWINSAVCAELLWIAEKMEVMSGIRILDAEEWGSENTDLTLFSGLR